MRHRPLHFPALALLAAAAQAGEPQVREIHYDPSTVVSVPVKRGVLTHIQLDSNETITEVASGLGSDCAKPEAAWCVAAPAGGQSIFVKPKTAAHAPNNLAVVTDRRTHSFRFVVLPDGDTRSAVYRLVVKPAIAPASRESATEPSASPTVSPVLPDIQVPSSADVVAERLRTLPKVVNTDYSIAEGKHGADIVPTLVFDDGRFTYFRFPGNRDVPSVFHVLGDSSETLVNARMEGDLLAVDRVSRRLMLRAGSAVVGVWNEAFDLDGRPPVEGTTAQDVRRVLKESAAADPRREPSHE